MLFNRSERSLSDKEGTIAFGIVGGLTISKVVDSYTFGRRQTTIATALKTAKAGSTINHLRFHSIRPYSAGVRCRNSTLIVFTPDRSSTGAPRHRKPWIRD